MKKVILYSFLLILVFYISACREISVTTKINNDGSFTRIITITGDSTDLFDKNLPYPIDDTWLMELNHDSIDSSLYVTYTKTYQNDDLLNKEIKSDTGWMRKLKRKVSIDKRFGFFFSYVTFKEIIEAANPFKKIPLSNHLTEEEIKWLKNEVQLQSLADSTKKDEIEEKALEVIFLAAAEEITDILETGIRKLNDLEISPQIAKNFEDSIKAKVIDWDGDSAEVFIDSLARWSGKENILKIKTISPNLFAAFDSKTAFMIKFLQMHDYEQFVVMPGLITETNSLSVKGNEVKWHVQPSEFLLTDYTMYVESRVVNYWMFIVTGVLVLGLLVLLVFKSFK